MIGLILGRPSDLTFEDARLKRSSFIASIGWDNLLVHIARVHVVGTILCSRQTTRSEAGHTHTHAHNSFDDIIIRHLLP
jgi:hypothetical protein